jgi:hypothetical protein
MNTLVLGSTAVIAVACVVVGVIVYRRPRTLNVIKFQNKWRDMQKMLANKDNWQPAVVQADKLLDEALRKRHFKGKTMGERLTKAQHILTDNESVWFGHKLRNKIESEPDTKLKEKDVKSALLGIRQALKDLGAFTDGK